MRNRLEWIIGFGLFFLLFGGFFLVSALDQPSAWLPIAFGLIFYGILWFSPRVGLKTRVRLSVLFGAISCALWMHSNRPPIVPSQIKLRVFYEGLLILVAIVAATFAAISIQNDNPRPNLRPIVILMILGWAISYFSSSHGAANPMVNWVMHALGIGKDSAETLVVAARKTGHFMFYGFVALAGFALAFRNGAAKKICLIAGFCTALGFAVFDETRQTTMPDRGGSAWDVLLDLSGASAALLCARAIAQVKTGRRPTSGPKRSTL